MDAAGSGGARRSVGQPLLSARLLSPWGEGPRVAKFFCFQRAQKAQIFYVLIFKKLSQHLWIGQLDIKFLNVVYGQRSFISQLVFIKGRDITVSP